MSYYTYDGKLIYAGRVGTGMPDKVLGDLRRRLEPLTRKTSPLGVPPPRTTRFGSSLVLSRVHWAARPQRSHSMRTGSKGNAPSGWGSRFALPALEVRVQDLQPVAARPAPIAAAGPLRHDPLEAEPASVGEHDRALSRQGFAEHDAVDAVNEPR